jgi:hypothetical protein
MTDATVAFIRIGGFRLDDEQVFGMVVGGADKASVWRAAEQALLEKIAIARHDSRFRGRIQLEVNEAVTPRDVADSFGELARQLETAACRLKIASGAPIRVSFSPPPAARPEAPPSSLRDGSLADDLDAPSCLAIFGSSVFWQSSKSRQIFRVDIAGGPVEMVTGPIDGLRSLVAAGSMLIGAGGSCAYRIDPRTRQVATLADWCDDELDHGLSPDAVVHGNWIYANTNTHVVRVPLTGGSYEPVPGGIGASQALALHDGDLVFFDRRDKICALPIGGGQARVIAEVEGVYGVASDGESLYWTDPYDLAVRKRRPSGDTVTVYKGDLEPHWIVGARGRVVWTASGAIMRADAGGKVTILADDLEWPDRLAMTDDVVVAALVPRNRDPGQLIRLAVP